MRFAITLLGLITASQCQAQNWEMRAIEALKQNDPKVLANLAKEFRQVPATELRKLPVRIRSNTVDFTFQGQHPGDQNPLHLMEYLIASHDKGYEALMIAGNAELVRLQALAPLFKKPVEHGAARNWTASLTWIEDGQPRSVRLQDLIAQLEPQLRRKFLDGLAVNVAGLGGSTNVEALALLPNELVPAELTLTFRLISDD